jgi:hypothetical protein
MGYLGIKNDRTLEPEKLKQAVEELLVAVGGAAAQARVRHHLIGWNVTAPDMSDEELRQEWAEIKGRYKPDPVM